MKEIKEIKAQEGYYLTQVAEVGEERLFLTAIKGANINEEDWREVTEEEYASIMVARQALRDEINMLEQELKK